MRHDAKLFSIFFAIFEGKEKSSSSQDADGQKKPFPPSVPRPNTRLRRSRPYFKPRFRSTPDRSTKTRRRKVGSLEEKEGKFTTRIFFPLLPYGKEEEEAKCEGNNGNAIFLPPFHPPVFLRESQSPRRLFRGDTKVGRERGHDTLAKI